MRAGIGFNRRVSISVLEHNLRIFSNCQAPKLTARAGGIESARYDFERFLPLQNIKKAGCRKAAFGYFSRINKNFKERDPVQRDFLGKKVTL